jgi:cytochrome P450
MIQAFVDNGMTPSELLQHMFVQMYVWKARSSPLQKLTGRSIAGSVTTATAICMTMLCLTTTPVAYAALQREADEAILDGRVSSPIAEAEAKRLPYLQAVIREGLRMYPPTTGLGSKQVPKGGDVVSGYFLPEGTQVGTNFFGIMRLKRIWGNDADVFRPERWLEADEQSLRVMNSVVDLDFGSGKYQCLGKPMAMMELNKVFFEVVAAPPASR